ncbi:MAG TPA: hypothetical protein VFN11_12175, partial [Ktedonobacterales bacterium]|nr:hypothetical protein [Ktedonobacterales bacterium]
IASVGMRMAGGAANLLIKQYFVRLADLLPSMPATSEAPSLAMAAMTSVPAAPDAASPTIAESEPPQPEQASASEPTPAAMDAPALVNPGMSGVSPGMMPSAGDDAGAQRSQVDAAPATDVNAAPETAAQPASTPMPEPTPTAEETPAPEPMAAPVPTAESAPMQVDAMMPPPTAPIHPPQPASLASAAAPAATPVKAPVADQARTPLMNFPWRAGLFIAVLVVVLLIVWLFIRQ